MAFKVQAEVVLTGPTGIKKISNVIKSQLKNATVDIAVKLSKDSNKNIKNLNKSLKSLQQTSSLISKNLNAISGSLNSLNASAATTAAQLKNTSSSISSVGASSSQAASKIKSAGGSIEDFGKQSALAVRRFAAFTLATSGIFGFARAITSAAKAGIEFQRELVKISQVTGQSIIQLSSLRDTIRSLSKELGSDANELAKVSTTLAQTGLTADEVASSLQALAKSTLAPTFGDIKQTTEGLVAALAQFGIAASDSEKVLGSLNSVSKSFAVESADLISAIRRTGGVFSAASGNINEPIDALNELSAIFTSVRATTRESADTIATGLRTIFTRIQRQDTIDFLKQFGVELTDLNGKFIGIFPAFEQLSSKLKGIISSGDAVTLSAIVEELGGVRQAGKLIPAIAQFDKAAAALKVAQQGAAEGLGGDVDKALGSLSVQIDKTRANFAALITEFTESSAFQSTVQTILGLANALIEVTRTLKPLIPLLSSLATIQISRSLVGFTGGFLGGIKERGGFKGLGSGRRGFNKGGLVPGTGSTDTVPAMLTPGEFVIKKSSVSSLGAGNLASMNKFASGGIVRGSRNSYGPKDPEVTSFNKAAQRGFSSDAFTVGSKDTGLSTIKQQKGKNKGTVLVDANLVLSKLEPKDKDGRLDTGAIFLRSDGGAKPPSKLFSKIDKQLLSQALTKSSGKKGISLEVNKDLPFSINSGLVSNSPGPSLAFRSNVRKSARGVSSDLIKKIGGGELKFNNGKFNAAYKKSNPEQVEGNIFEAALAGAANTPFDNKAEANDTFDFPRGVGSGLSKASGIPKGLLTDAKRTFNQGALSSLIKKVVSYTTGTLTRERINLNKTGLNQDRLTTVSKLPGFNRGGQATGTDTVPALLTPGEFVINKNSAQSIGYDKLGQMNNVARFASGGVVRGNRNSYGFGAGASFGSFGPKRNRDPITPEINDARNGLADLGSTAFILGTQLSTLTSDVATTGEKITSLTLSLVGLLPVLDNFKKGQESKALAGAKSFGKALIVAGFAASITNSIATPIINSFRGKLEEIDGVKGIVGESASSATGAGGLSGALSGAVGGGTLGFQVAGPYGAAIGSAIGLIGGGIIGAINANAEKKKFDELIQLRKSATDVSDAFKELEKNIENQEALGEIEKNLKGFLGEGLKNIKKTTVVIGGGQFTRREDFDLSGLSKFTKDIKVSNEDFGKVFKNIFLSTSGVLSTEDIRKDERVRQTSLALVLKEVAIQREKAQQSGIFDKKDLRRLDEQFATIIQRTIDGKPVQNAGGNADRIKFVKNVNSVLLELREGSLNQTNAQKLLIAETLKNAEAFRSSSKELGEFNDGLSAALNDFDAVFKNQANRLTGLSGNIQAFAKESSSGFKEDSTLKQEQDAIKNLKLPKDSPLSRDIDNLLKQRRGIEGVFESGVQNLIKGVNKDGTAGGVDPLNITRGRAEQAIFASAGDIDKDTESSIKKILDSIFKKTRGDDSLQKFSIPDLQEKFANLSNQSAITGESSAALFANLKEREALVKKQLESEAKVTNLFIKREKLIRDFTLSQLQQGFSNKDIRARARGKEGPNVQELLSRRQAGIGLTSRGDNIATLGAELKRLSASGTNENRQREIFETLSQIKDINTLSNAILSENVKNTAVIKTANSAQISLLQALDKPEQLEELRKTNNSFVKVFQNQGDITRTDASSLLGKLDSGDQQVKALVNSAAALRSDQSGKVVTAKEVSDELKSTLLNLIIPTAGSAGKGIQNVGIGSSTTQKRIDSNVTELEALQESSRLAATEIFKFQKALFNTTEVINSITAVKEQGNAPRLSEIDKKSNTIQKNITELEVALGTRRSAASTASRLRYTDPTSVKRSFPGGDNIDINKLGKFTNASIDDLKRAISTGQAELKSLNNERNKIISDTNSFQKYNNNDAVSGQGNIKAGEEDVKKIGDLGVNIQSAVNDFSNNVEQLNAAVGDNSNISKLVNSLSTMNEKIQITLNGELNVNFNGGELIAQLGLTEFQDIKTYIGAKVTEVVYKDQSIAKLDPAGAIVRIV